MVFQFDRIIDRTHTHSVKWDYREKIFGKRDILPMWVADMDFSCAPEILQNLRDWVNHGVFGYTAHSREYFEGIVRWLNEKHQWKVKKSWIMTTPGVIPGISMALQSFSMPGDQVVIQPPVYKPFFESVKNNGRKLVLNDLSFDGSRYRMDFDKLESQLDKRTRLLILCNPHNPVGRVWSKEELLKLGKICLENNVMILSDEIHYDIVYAGYRHYPLASLSPELSAQTVTFTSPAKTFNIQGLPLSSVIISGKEKREKFNQSVAANGLALHNNALAMAAGEAAYREGGPWLNDLLDYLEKNRELLVTFCREELKGVNVIVPDGTYLAWLDFRALDMEPDPLNTFLVHRARVGLIDGREFGSGGAGFQRLNFGCPRETLKEGLIRIRDAIRNM